MVYDTFCIDFTFAADNVLDAFIPELWAQTALMQLDDNLVYAPLVNRDFENNVASYGDIVNTRRVARSTPSRKGINDSIVAHDVTATNVPVALNQLAYSSFLIRDAEQSLSFQELSQRFLVEEIKGMARFVDSIIAGQFPYFLGNSIAGGAFTSANSKNKVLDLRKMMNKNLVPDEGGRNLVWTPDSESELARTDIFIQANTSGDNGYAMMKGSLGPNKLGFNHFMTTLQPSVTSTSVTLVTGAINMAAGAAVGTTALTVDGFSAAIANNSFVYINGDVHRVVSTTGGATPTAIVITAPGLRTAVADNDVISVVAGGAVNNAAGYAAGYAKDIALDGFAKFPVAGQMITFGTSATAAIYTVVKSDGAALVTLDRPLDVSLADDVVAKVGPAGNYNFAFHKDAISLVSRPLITPNSPGVRAFVATYNGLSIRVSISYDNYRQGVLVTIDLLFGVKVLDERLGAVLIG